MESSELKERLQELAESTPPLDSDPWARFVRTRRRARIARGSSIAGGLVAIALVASFIALNNGPADKQLSSSPNRHPTSSSTATSFPVVALGQDVPAAAIESANSEKTCGSWATQPSTDPTAAAFASQYGGVWSCGLYGTTWVIATPGKSTPAVPGPMRDPLPGTEWQSPGFLALYQCGLTDVNCLDPASGHSFGKWHFVQDPIGGVPQVTQFPVPNVIGVLLKGSNGVPYYVNVETGTWVSEKGTTSAALSSCMTEWGQVSSSVPNDAPLSDIQQFFNRYPDCQDAQ